MKLSPGHDGKKQPPSGVTSVAMEATGVYWIRVFQILEASGFEVKLVNAHHVKTVPGRKSDVKDCQWLQQLHTYGLLSGLCPGQKITGGKNKSSKTRQVINHAANAFRMAAMSLKFSRSALGAFFRCPL